MSSNADDLEYERNVRQPQRRRVIEEEMAKILDLRKELARRQDDLRGYADSCGIAVNLPRPRSDFRTETRPHDEPEKAPEVELPPLTRVDVALSPIPPREWAVHERIPARNVALLSGEGAVGKSTLLKQLAAVATLRREEWLGVKVEHGPVMYLSCEDDADEDRRRLEAIATHYEASRAEMMRGGLHVYDFAGRDAVLGVSDRRDHIRPTPLFEQIKREAMIIKPRLLIIDAVADAFGGQENNRAQTRQFVSLMRGIAIESGAAVILASHPSLTGISSNSGLSGSTAWHNSCRARGYLKSASEDEDEDADNDLRVLEWRKNNYGPKAERILLRWRDGVFRLSGPHVGSFERMATVDDLFIDLLRRFTKQSRNVSPSRSPTYAPTVFAAQPEAKAAKVKAAALVDSMERLLAENRIKVITEGPPSRRRDRIVEAQA